jgi:hypothetical protein
MFVFHFERLETPRAVYCTNILCIRLPLLALQKHSVYPTSIVGAAQAFCVSDFHCWRCKTFCVSDFHCWRRTSILCIRLPLLAPHKHSVCPTSIVGAAQAFCVSDFHCWRRTSILCIRLPLLATELYLRSVQH